MVFRQLSVGWNGFWLLWLLFCKKSGLEVFILTRRVPNTPAFEIYNGVPVYRLPVTGPRPVASLIFTLTAIPYH